MLLEYSGAGFDLTAVLRALLTKLFLFLGLDEFFSFSEMISNKITSRPTFAS